MINRELSKQIQERMFQGKAIIVYGPRQSGKTTLITELLKDYSEAKVIYNGDEPDVRLELTGISSTGFKAMIGNSKIVFIDEAQRIPDIGITIKLIVDNYPDIQVIATGSSAFELTGKFKEPLTGRKYEFHLFPLSFSELAAHEGKMAEKASVKPAFDIWLLSRSGNPYQSAGDS